MADTFESYKNNGNAFFKEGNYEGAIASYDKCIELESWNPVGYSNKAMALIKMGLYENAIEVCNVGKRKLNPFDTKHVTLKKKLDYRLDMAKRLLKEKQEKLSSDSLNNSKGVNNDEISENSEYIDLDIIPINSLPTEFASL